MLLKNICVSILDGKKLLTPEPPQSEVLPDTARHMRIHLGRCPAHLHGFYPFAVFRFVYITENPQ